MTNSVMQTYAPADVVFDKGEGVYLFAEDQKRYLDFGAGVADLFGARASSFGGGSNRTGKKTVALFQPL